MPLPHHWKPATTPAQHSWLLDLLGKPFQQLRINISEPMTHGVLISTELPARHPVQCCLVVLSRQKAPRGQVWVSPTSALPGAFRH